MMFPKLLNRRFRGIRCCALVCEQLHLRLDLHFVIWGMTTQRFFYNTLLSSCDVVLWCMVLPGLAAVEKSDSAERRLLYVAAPGIRDYLQYGGHGILVFDIDDGHKFVRRIASAGLNAKGQPDNVKGICASVSLQRLYVSTIGELISFDLTTDAIVWE